MAIWKISFLFFSPPEKPTFTSRFANSCLICTRAIFSFMSFRKAAAVRGSSPRAFLREFTAVFMKFVMETPGISTGYWNDRKIPAHERSSGLIFRRSRPMKVTAPSVTVYWGLPANTDDNVLFPAPLGPMTTCVSPLRTVRSTPFRISLSSTLALSPSIFNKISFSIIFGFYLQMYYAFFEYNRYQLTRDTTPFIR